MSLMHNSTCYANFSFLISLIEFIVISLIILLDQEKDLQNSTGKLAVIPKLGQIFFSSFRVVDL